MKSGDRVDVECKSGGRWHVRYVHKISPRPDDGNFEVALSQGDFADRKTLARALREAHVLSAGGRLATFRVEGNRVVAFPSGPFNVWHAIVLTHVGAS